MAYGWIKVVRESQRQRLHGGNRHPQALTLSLVEKNQDWLSLASRTTPSKQVFWTAPPWRTRHQRCCRCPPSIWAEFPPKNPLDTAPLWMESSTPWPSRVALILSRSHKDQCRCPVTPRKPLHRGINALVARGSRTAASGTPSGQAAHGAGPWLHCSHHTAARRGRRRPPPPAQHPRLQ